MNASVSPAPLAPDTQAHKFPFDLVVAYEDTDTRNRALHLYDHLAQQLLDDSDFKCSWWKFDHLAAAILRREATDAAVNANMIVLSLRARDELSPLQRAWIENWSARRTDRQGALVAMIAGVASPETEAPIMLAGLRDAAHRAGMDFFTHAFGATKPAFTLPAPPAAPAALADTPFVQEILHQSVPVFRWGINE